MLFWPKFYVDKITAQKYWQGVWTPLYTLTPHLQYYNKHQWYRHKRIIDKIIYNPFFTPIMTCSLSRTMCFIIEEIKNVFNIIKIWNKRTEIFKLQSFFPIPYPLLYIPDSKHSLPIQKWWHSQKWMCVCMCVCVGGYVVVNLV